MDIPLSSPAHPGSSGRLPAPGVPIPGLRPSKLFPQPPPHPHNFLSHEAPLPPQSPRQPLAKAQIGAFDPGFMAGVGEGGGRTAAGRQESLPYLDRLSR